MKIPPVILLLIPLLALSGCNQSPRSEVGAVVTAYTGTLDELLVMRRRGQINDDNWARVKQVVRVASPALDELVAGAMDDPPRIESLRALNAALAELAAIRNEVRR